MKVLHFIPDLSVTAGSNILGYKAKLIEAMSERADVHVLTSCVMQKAPQGVSVHKYSPLKNVFGSIFSGFDKFVVSINPDIVHIHSCWNIQAYYFLKCCLKHRLQVVVTVDGQLNPWHISHCYLLCKVPKTLVYQGYVLQKASAVHAVSSFEKRVIEKWMSSSLNFKQNINDKTKIIEPFNIRYNRTAGDMAAELLALYRETIDSHPFFNMSEADSRAEDLLLQAALPERDTMSPVLQRDIEKMSSLTEESRRLILLHSRIQGVSDLLLTGARKCKMSFPEIQKEYAGALKPIVSSNVDNTKEAYDKNIGTLMSETLLSEQEKNICRFLYVLNLKLKHSSDTVKRSDFIALYTLLRHTDYNEVLLRAKISELRINKFSARVLHIMKERYGLSEGFMFVEPLDDNKTDELRKKLYKTEIQ